jgi:hypothetical protein
MLIADAVKPAPVGIFQVAAEKSCKPVVKVLAAPSNASPVVVGGKVEG